VRELKHLTNLLAEGFVAWGTESELALRLAPLMVRLLVAAGLATQKGLDLWETDAAIHRARGRGATCAEICAKFGASRSRVYDTVKRHGKRRKAALRCFGETA
jgi:hypothetical protein